MTPTTHIYFEVQCSTGGLTGKNGNYSFATAKLASDVATEFKNNPRSHNEQMTDDNVAYWQKQTYTIVRKIIIEDKLQTI